MRLVQRRERFQSFQMRQQIGIQHTRAINIRPAMHDAVTDPQNRTTSQKWLQRG